MKRRSFNKGILLLGVAGCASPKQTLVDSPTPKTKILPQRLHPWDTVGIIAPASSFPLDRLDKCQKNMEKLGLNIKWGKNLKKQYGYLAGTDEERVADIHAMFEDDDVKAIWCIRGGYGCTRILEMLNFDLIKSNPKIFIGYSDITALLIAIQQQTGLVTFHGPVASSDFSDYAISGIRSILMKPKSDYIVHPPARPITSLNLYTINEGRAKGQLTGGNLSLLAAMCGTKHGLEVRNKIVIIEDIGEAPYRIDRMLTQIKSNYPLSSAAGIMLGVFENCEASYNVRNISLRNTLHDCLGDLDIPIAYGFPFGHITNQCVLPVGIEVGMDTEDKSIAFYEAAVQ